MKHTTGKQSRRLLGGQPALERTPSATTAVSDSLSVSRDPAQLPAQEQELLDHLSVPDLEKARATIQEISRTLARLAPLDLEVTRLQAFDLLGNINRLVWKGRDGGPQRRRNRQVHVQSLSRVSSPQELLAVFEKRVHEILAPRTESPTGRPSSILRAKAFIVERYHQKLSLKDVAAHLGLSNAYLSALFRKECGCTLTRYVHQMRIRKSEQLIREGTEPLAKIAIRVGYRNYRDFHRNFVRYQKSSPTRFRQRASLDVGPSAGEAYPG